MEPQARPDAMTETALQSLHDIAVPPPISWMPQTWGWVVVGVVLLAAALAAALFWLRRYRANAYRRAAVGALAAIGEDVRNPVTRYRGLQALATLLKRTALSAWPRTNVASLSGDDWVGFMEAHERSLADGLARLLDDVEYQAPGKVETIPPSTCDEVVVAARRWIERHHVSA